MKDVYRIERILHKLKRRWEQNSDQSLCQVMTFLAGRVDAFYVDDEFIEEKLDEQLGENDDRAIGDSSQRNVSR